MGRTLTYPKTKSTTVNRYDSRATYDLGAIHEIVNTSSVLHVSFAADPDGADPFPATLPMIGVMGSYEHPSASLDEPLDCYLHGYVSSRIMRLAKASPDGSSKGMPVTIAATKVDGIVLALTPNHHSYNYRSVILHGYATVVDTVAEKLWAMELITNSVVPNRWKNTRVPPNNVEMQSTNILRVQIVSGSGKIRTGGPHDDKADTSRADITARTWVGVVPVKEVLCEPVPSSENQVAALPDYLSDYLKEQNQQAENYAVEAAKLP